MRWRTQLLYLHSQHSTLHPANGGDFLRYAYIVPTRRHFPRFFEERIHGVSFLRCELPNTSAAMVKRCVLTLRRCGVRYILNDSLNGRFPLVSTRELWQDHAAELALLWMERESVRPSQVVVGLLAKRVTGAVCRAAEILSNHVRAIALDLPESEGLANRLQLRTGIPVFTGTGTVNLCFDEQNRSYSKNILNIGTIQPEINGFALYAQIEHPADCPAEPLYAALVHEGTLSRSEIHLQFANNS